MKKLNKITKKVISVILVLMFSMSSFLMLFPLNPTISDNIDELVGEEKSTEMNSPSLSSNGDVKWWNASFNYRRPINITNPYGEAFTNFIAKITFNYTLLVSTGNMNESLKDVRIVENGILRDYFIEKDYPNKDFATVWFETDILADHSDQDTYMYYGNENASFASSYLMDKNPDGLIWYKFEEIVDEGARDVVIDSMGNYNATVRNSATLGSGAVGSGMSFDKTQLTNLEIQSLHYSGANIIPELTICLWFNTSYSGGTTYENWAFIDFDRSEYFNFFIRPDNGRLGFSTTAEGGTGPPNYNPNTNDFYGTNQLNDGDWHFGAAKYDGQDKYLYYKDTTGDLNDDNTVSDPHNGAAIGDRVGDSSNDDPRYGFMGCGSEATTEGGTKNGASNYYTGLLDELRVFNESLSRERIEWIAKNYQLITDLKGEEPKEATVKIYVKDIDGRIVSGAKVFIFNETQKVNYTETTGELGYVDFLSVETLYYNITISYTLFDGTDYNEMIVFNSSKMIPSYGFIDVKLYEVYINVRLWSIDFEIKDVNEEAMGYGYVLVYNKSGPSDLIANLTLDKELGIATFRGTNISDVAKYYYNVYYDNDDYNPPRPLLKTGTIDRATYLTNKLNDTSFILVNQTNESEEPEKYRVEQKVYATGSNETHIGNIKITNATIALRKMDYTLTRVAIYSIDNNNTYSTNPIFEKPSSSYPPPQIEDTIKLNVTEFGDIFGLLIVVEGDNSTLIGRCNGTIDTSYYETCNQYVNVQMSKLIIKVYDREGIWKSEWGSVRVNIVNGSTFVPITSLLTNAEGIAKGEINSELDFWYFSGEEYNFSLMYGGDERFFNVTSALDVWEQSYDYTLTTNATLEFRILTSIADFVTTFEEIYSDSSKEWGQDFTFRVRFLSTSNYTTGRDWEPVVNADFVDWEITDLLSDIVYDSGEMTPEIDGYFNYTINSGFLIGGEQYYFKIYGEKSGYQNPAPLQLLFTVSTKATNIGVYNTSNPTQNLGNNVTLYYGETIQLTVFYSSGVLLEGATVTYEWQFIDNPIVINETETGYYSFEIDTSIADVGTYKIDINTAKQNYTSQYFRFDISIGHRPTSLNDDTSLHHISKMLWVRQSYNFTFEYKDILSDPDANLIDLEQAYYQWYKVSTNGSIVGAISDEINLIEGLNSTYVLDFNTDSREVGSYAIFVTMQKNNYEVRTALIDLTIQKRIITWDWNLDQNQINVIQGEDVILELKLTDLSDPTDSQNITGATVMLILGSKEYELTDVDGDGIYTYTFTTDNIDTFFASKVFTGEISVIREDYVSEEIPITIVVGMTEIFPGFPMFYFLMIVGSAIAIVGSLTTYRIVQQRRIPTFVKKARTMKKSIKGNKAVSDSLLYPSKEEFLVKKLGDKWTTIGLSLEDIMGVKEKKKMKLSEAKEEFKGGAD